MAENYAPADGLSADLPDLKVRNLLVVASEDGVGVISASMFNETSEPLSVRLTIADGVLDTTVEVPADGRLTLTGAGGSPKAEGGSSAATQVIAVAALPTPPGGAVPIGITSPGGGTVTRTAPVLLDGGPYEGFVPTPDTASATAPTSAP